MRKTPTPDQVFAQLGAVWQKARGTRAMPARADINPALAGGALRYAALLDVVQGPPIDFRYRLIGQHTIDSYGSNFTGESHTGYFGTTPGRPAFDALVKCVQTRTPQEALGQFRNSNGTPCRARIHAWPLSDDGVSVTGLLAACVFIDADID